MRTRAFLLIAALLLAPGAASAQWRAAPPPSVRAPFAAPGTAGEPRTAALPAVGEQRSGAGRHLLIGALAGAAVGMGVYVIDEETSSHTDHSYDAVVRFSMVSAGALAGALGGAVMYALRAK